MDEEEEEGEGDEEVDADEEDDEMLDIVKPTSLHTKYPHAAFCWALKGIVYSATDCKSMQNKTQLGAAAHLRFLKSACFSFLYRSQTLAVDFSLNMCSTLLVILQGLHLQANEEHGTVASEEPPGQRNLGEASINHGIQITHFHLESDEDDVQPDRATPGNWASEEPREAPLLPREQRMRRPRSDRGEGRLEALAGVVASGGALAEEAGVQWGAGVPDRAAGQQPGLRTLEHRSMAFLQHLRQYTPALHAGVKPLCTHLSKRQWLCCICLTGKSPRPYPA